jgi:hypothetical protein
MNKTQRYSTEVRARAVRTDQHLVYSAGRFLLISFMHFQ